MLRQIIQFWDESTAFGTTSTATKIIYKFIEIEHKASGTDKLERSERHDEIVKLLSAAISEGMNYDHYRYYQEWIKKGVQHDIAKRLHELTQPLLFNSPIFEDKNKLLGIVLGVCIDYYSKISDDCGYLIRQQLHLANAIIKSIKTHAKPEDDQRQHAEHLQVYMTYAFNTYIDYEKYYFMSQKEQDAFIAAVGKHLYDRNAPTLLPSKYFSRRTVMVHLLIAFREIKPEILLKEYQLDFLKKRQELQDELFEHKEVSPVFGIRGVSNIISSYCHGLYPIFVTTLQNETLEVKVDRGDPVLVVKDKVLKNNSDKDVRVYYGDKILADDQTMETYDIETGDALRIGN